MTTKLNWLDKRSSSITFSGATSIEVFASMETKLLSNAIEWIGRDELGFSLMYQCVRGMPSLFETVVAAKDGISKKRKLNREAISGRDSCA